MRKATTVFLTLFMLLTVLPSVSADHNSTHECTDDDPCDDNDTGCETLVSVGGCTYDKHTSCYYAEGSDGGQGEYCRHDTYQCMVNLLRHCYLHGSTLLLAPDAFQQ